MLVSADTDSVSQCGSDELLIFTINVDDLHFRLNHRPSPIESQDNMVADSNSLELIGERRNPDYLSFNVLTRREKHPDDGGIANHMLVGYDVAT